MNVAAGWRVLRLSILCVALPLALGSACYAPEGLNCTVSCSADTDCISGQACTSDHFCAATEIATCAGRTASDAGTGSQPDAARQAPGVDARPAVDAMPRPADAMPPMPDAMPPPPQFQLTVIISGGGSVRTNVGAECDRGTCTYSVAAGTAVTLTAVNHGKNVFQRWQGAPCMGQPASCQLTITAATTASAVFDHH